MCYGHYTMTPLFSLFSFEGRIGRGKYCISLLVIFVVRLVTLFFLKGSNGIAGFLALLITPFLIWFYLANGSKRCHDRGNSGFYLLIPFYPLFLAFAAGDVGVNWYGPNPDKSGAK